MEKSIKIAPIRASSLSSPTCMCTTTEKYFLSLNPSVTLNLLETNQIETRVHAEFQGRGQRALQIPAFPIGLSLLSQGHNLLRLHLPLVPTRATPHGHPRPTMQLQPWDHSNKAKPIEKGFVVFRPGDQGPHVKNDNKVALLDG